MLPHRCHVVIGFTTIVGLFAGCQSDSPQHSPAMGSHALEVVTLSSPPAPVLAVDSVSQTRSVDASKRSGPPPWPTNSTTQAWIPLETWTEYNRFGKPQRASSAARPSYVARMPDGIISLRIDSQQVNWHGLECWLAYPPQIMKGVPYIHALDAEKNLQPLVQALVPLTNGNRTIVIDPGHGGVDGGARSVWHNSLEKDFTLDWALRLRSLLMAKGWRVFLTRTNDTDMSLAARVVFADHVHADLFLSLHFNSAFPSIGNAGIETYCLTPAGLPSNLVRNFEDNPSQVYANNAFDKQNVQYAHRLHRELLKVTGVVDRGVRRARFMTVLQGQHRPAVLLEGGYLSNLREAQMIASPAH